MGLLNLKTQSLSSTQGNILYLFSPFHCLSLCNSIKWILDHLDQCSKYNFPHVLSSLVFLLYSLYNYFIFIKNWSLTYYLSLQMHFDFSDQVINIELVLLIISFSPWQLVFYLGIQFLTLRKSPMIRTS